MIPPNIPGYYEEPLLPNPQIPDLSYSNEFPPSISPQSGANEITSPTITSSPLPEQPEPKEPIQPPEEVPHAPIDAETPSPPIKESSSSTDDITEYPSSEPPFPSINSPSRPEPEHNGYPPAGAQPQPPFELPGIPESHSSLEPNGSGSPIEPVPIATDEPLIPSQASSIQPESTGYPERITPGDVQPTGYPLPETPQPFELPGYTSASPSPLGDVSTFPPILVETTRRPGDEQAETETPSPSVPSSPTNEEPDLSGNLINII